MGARSALAFNRSSTIVVRAATRIRSDAAWRSRWRTSCDPSARAASKLERNAAMAASARLWSSSSRPAVNADVRPVARSELAGCLRSPNIGVTGSRRGPGSTGGPAGGPASLGINRPMPFSARRCWTVRGGSGSVDLLGSPGKLMADSNFPLVLCSRFCTARCLLRLRM